MARSKPSIDLAVWSGLSDSFASTYRDEVHVSEALAREIQGLILRQELDAGDRLPSERDLSEVLGVSRPTISKTLKILALQGLVTAKRGSGTFIADEPGMSNSPSVDLILNLNADSVPNLLEMRLMLELRGMNDAILRADDADLERTRQYAEALAATNIDEIANWMSADIRFHHSIAAASKNQYLEMFFLSTHSAIVRFEFRDWLASGRAPSWQLEADQQGVLMDVHWEMHSALVERDPHRGERAIIAHHELLTEHVSDTLLGD